MKKNKHNCSKCGKFAFELSVMKGLCRDCSDREFKENQERNKSIIAARQKRYLEAKVNGTLKHKWQYYRFQFFDTKPQGESLNTVFFGVSRFYFNQTEKEYRIHLFRYMVRFYFQKVEKCKYI